MATGTHVAQTSKEHATTWQRVILFIYALFAIGILLAASHFDQTLQYNNIWLLITSVIVAVVMMFIPDQAELRLGILKATGAAAILGFGLYQSWLFANKKLDLNVQGIEIERNNLQKRLDDITSELAALEIANQDLQATNQRLEIDKAVCERISSQGSVSLPQLDSRATTKEILSAVNAAIKNIARASGEARAAATNTADAGTCSSRALRASTSIEAAANQLSEAKGLLSSLQ